MIPSENGKYCEGPVDIAVHLILAAAYFGVLVVALLALASCASMDPTYYPYKCTVDMKLKGEC